MREKFLTKAAAAALAAAFMLSTIVSFPSRAAQMTEAEKNGDPDTFAYMEWDDVDVGSTEDYNGPAFGESRPFSVSENSAIRRAPRQAGTWIQEPNGKWWYKHTNGSYTRNDWEPIGDKYYYFDNEGYMVTGWVSWEGKWYYCCSSGYMMIGWIQDGGKDYYLEMDGSMQTGWVPLDKWYYLDETSGAWINNTGTKMIQEALKHRGTPYVYGGTDLNKGVDCSGLTMSVHQLQGISLYHNAQIQYNNCRRLSNADLKPGDLVFYGSNSKGVQHVAFYCGLIHYDKDKVMYDGIVHASNGGVKIAARTYWNAIVGYGTYWR